MSRKLEILTHSVDDSIDATATQNSLVEVGADVIVVPEAASEKSGIAASTERAFTNAGYQLYRVLYNDDDGRADRHCLAMAVKTELDNRVRVNSARLAGRSALFLTMIGGQKIMGVHFDERNEHRRQLQAARAIANVGHSAIIAGDYGSAEATGLTSSLLRLIQPLTHGIETDAGAKLCKRRPLQAIRTLGQMADGTTLRLFQENGFQDADPTHTPTFRHGPLNLQLDHIQYRGDISLVEPATAETVGISNHRRVRASFMVPGQASI